MTEVSRGASESERAAIRRRRLIRTISVLVGVVLAVSFIAENSQPVKVHFWVVSADPRLIWVILGCLAFGVGLGFLLARQRKKGSTSA